MEMVTPGHPRWEEFLDRLYGPEGCNFRERAPGDPDSMVWNCTGDDQSHARRILGRMGYSPVEVELSLQYYRDHSGYCDCEILMNVDREIKPGSTLGYS
jgi:hypothetical protein